MGLKDFVNSLGEMFCLDCGRVIESGEVYYIDYPRDYYCRVCGKIRDKG